MPLTVLSVSGGSVFDMAKIVKGECEKGKIEIINGFEKYDN
jgi:alcohol dehydrogenase class IV